MTTLQHTQRTHQFASFTGSFVNTVSAFGLSIVKRTTGALNAMSASFDEHQRTVQDDYLAQSTSITDLEHRMHDLERHDGQPKLNMMTGMH